MRNFVCGFFVFLLIAGLWPISALAGSDRVTLSVPREVFDGSSVPVSVKLSEPLASNEVVSILANGEIAAMVAADSDVGLNDFTVYVRLLTPESPVSATLAVDNELVDFWDKKVKVVNLGVLEDDFPYKTSTSGAVNGFKHMVNVQLHKSVCKKDYVKGLKITTNIGEIFVNATPYLASDPYFIFKSVHTFENISYETFAYLDFW